jgi:hypothetical protein
MSLRAHPGGQVYCNDAAYDSYTGRLVAEYTVTRPLRNGGMLRRPVQIIDVGRSALVEPCNGDEQLAEDHTFIGSGAATKAAEQTRRNRLARDEDRLAVLVAILRRRPGGRVMQLQAETGGRISQNIIGRLLRERSDLFRFEGNERKARWFVKDEVQP